MFTTTTDNRKRKQDHHLSSSMPTSSWSDFIYSSPSSPSIENNLHFNFDTLFDQQQLDQSGSNSRRHSVAVGEMDYHSFDFIKQDINIIPATNNNSVWDDIQVLLNSTNTSGFTDLLSNTTIDRPIHKRTLSLREDNPHYATLLSPALSTITTTSSSSSNFFNSSFLDALVANENNDTATIMSDVTFNDDLLKFTNSSSTSTITPSAITNEINTMADWLLEQQEVKEKEKEKEKQQQKRQRRNSSTNSPISPTMASSLSSMSPSPPITPMQPVSLGFELICQQEWGEQQPSFNKNSLISARIVQGETIAFSLKPLIQEYLVQNNGERTVIVLTSRVAQKSYGTEKRFLCPPPTTILKGANWWTSHNHGNLTDKSNLLMTDPKKSNFFTTSTTAASATTISSSSSPPKLTIHISGEAITQTGVIEWQTSDGTIIDPSSSNASTVVSSGRCVSKQLYINDADEKRKRVEVLAKIQLGNGVQLGTFPSKGIKVISKPSKKRQSIKNMELCIHHGTTISLFNRIRSQTVSTKYLGVSNGLSNDNNGTCFVARTGSWDPFVIWIVDTGRSSETTTMPHHQHHPNNIHFPPPPAIALQTPSTAQQPIAVHYNQPVVLQCVTTGLVSPVMIIRKVDKGSMALGGNGMINEDFFSKTVLGGECGDESLGDPVSQLHKIAFQIVQDPSLAMNHPSKSSQQQDRRLSTSNHYRIPQSNHSVTYLACLNDVVGMHKVAYNRHLVPACQPRPDMNSTSLSDLLLKGNLSKDENLYDRHSSTPLSQQQQQQQQQSSSTTIDAKMTPTTKARRRMSSSTGATETTKGRRSSLLSERRSSSLSDTSGLEGACWTEDVSDAAVWTIVGTDCATYTFWTPSNESHHGFNMPFHHTRSTPITPFPLLHEISMTEDDNKDRSSLTLIGENITRDLNIWFGDIKSPQTEYKSRDSITCKIPDINELMNSPTIIADDEDVLKKKIPLLLVRGDGIVYRTDQFYVF
ncbi:uncharacterized protein BX663DRAFT_514350 [Cokeromyces recurvatus]|uniref:uncharacterized protein n=1 Tax=Cokeromyces recurvatus TaxID=90255 RepID=UPI002220EA4C|nr:uncharacterized protein BX663DRAFT_514350 [Cokeromyces recurvatus]KAI7901420.1 hypothetical protein BX663DRAFT_514350 [Cokeromyces recurvatus]